MTDLDDDKKKTKKSIGEGQHSLQQADDDDASDLDERHVELEVPLRDTDLRAKMLTINRRVEPFVSVLVERLRIILEPTKRGGLIGDFITGKRLNMRKIIPFIASNYTKVRR